MIIVRHAQNRKDDEVEGPIRKQKMYTLQYIIVFLSSGVNIYLNNWFLLTRIKFRRIVSNGF